MTVAPKIPKFACKPGCHACCGPVRFSDAERASAARHQPLLSWTPMDGKWVPTSALPDRRCPFLGAEGCTIYDDRPAICRLYGAVDHPLMTCRFGCGPKRKLSHEQAQALL